MADGFLYLGAVNSKAELPEPVTGSIALDLERSGDGYAYLWTVQDSEWVSVLAVPQNKYSN